MRYQKFVRLRQASSDAFEQALASARRTPEKLGYEGLEELAVNYRRLLHDHALARARFPGTAIARRLEHLVLAGTHWLQRDSGEHLPTLRRFFAVSFPTAMHRLAPLLALTTALFLVAGLLGFLLATVEPGLGAVFLSPEMLKGLEQGNLWTESIFSVTPGSVASSKIATNNLSVAITGWAGGALAGLGTLWVTLLNGIMLGAVMAITAHYGMSGKLLEFIAAHGPLEISCILVTAAAGLSIGRALIVADDVPRAERLRSAGRDAVIVLLGTLPWILVLGFVEGFISPSTVVPVVLKVLVGVSLELLFIAAAWKPGVLVAGRAPAEEIP